MNRQYIEDNQIIDRYLMNALSGSEAIAFEEAFVGDPELVAEIELHRQLIVGVRKADWATPSPNAPRPARSWLAYPTRSTARIVASATIVLLVIGVVILFSFVSNLSQQKEQMAVELAESRSPKTNAMVVPLGRTRGGENQGEPTIRLRLTPDVDSVVFVPDYIVGGDFEGYRYALTGDSDVPVWSNESESLTQAVVFPTHMLGPGNYHFKIYGVAVAGSETPLGQYAFTVLGD